jgi:hypothetical protein
MNIVVKDSTFESEELEIQVYMRPGNARGVYKSFPANAEGLKAIMELDVEKYATLIVRFPDDESFILSGFAAAMAQQNAQRAATLLTGSEAKFWGRSMILPDGFGWRAIYEVGVMKSNPMAMGAPPVGLNGRR